MSKNPQFGQMYPMNSDSYLGPLQSNWLAAHLGLKSYCAYETLPVLGKIIVERQSATNLCTERLDPIDADHITIVKPLNAASTAYRALKSAFEETTSKPGPSATSHSDQIIAKNKPKSMASPISSKAIPSQPKETDSSIVLLLDCQGKGLPIRFPADSTIYVLDTLALNGIMQYFSGARATDSFWPTPDTKAGFAYRCELTNYSEEPVFAVSMFFKVELLETFKDDNGALRAEGEKITASHSHLSEIPKIEANGGKFVFYVHNTTPQWTKVTPPVYVTLESAKKPDRLQVRLKQPSGYGPIPMYLSPWMEWTR